MTRRRSARRNDVTGPKLVNPRCKAGFYVISYANPAGLQQVGDFVELPAGHTTSCIQDCRYLWTGGPARGARDQRLRRSARSSARPRRRRSASSAPWATAGRSGSPTSPTRSGRRSPTSRSTCGATTATRTTRTTSTRTPRASRGSAAAAASAATRPAASIATRTRTAGAGDAVRSDPGRRRRRRRHGAADHVHAQLRPPDDGSVRAAGVKKGNVLAAPRRTSRPRATRAAGSCCPTSLTRWGGEPASKSTLESRTG